MKTKNIYNLCILVFALFLSGACTKMNDFHDVYLKNGETLYVGKVDSAKTFPGEARILLRYWISDPKAKKLVLYWKSRTDSMLFDIPDGSVGIPLEITIPNLDEGEYLFEMITRNKDMKNPSVVFYIGGRAYSQKFQASLTDRQIREAVFLPSGIAEVRWFGAVEKAVGTELVYTNKAGLQVQKFVPIDEDITTMADFASNLKYRTLFLPDPIAIDTFYTDFQSVAVGTIKELDKSKYAKWNPAGIPYNEVSATYSIAKLWDKNLDTWYIQNVANRVGPTTPNNFTFDLGQTVKLSRFVQWQRLTVGVVYEIQNIKKFEVWGASTANVTANFSGWVKLGDYESIKPSDLPWQSTSQLDRGYAAAGETFIVSPLAPPVRYIRYVVTETWSTGQNSTDKAVAVGEVSFFEKK